MGAAGQAGGHALCPDTKHHEGFALELGADYKATNTPAGRDLVGPWVEAFRAEGLKIGFYHSLLDWHHPEFPIDGLHPQRDDEQAQAAAKGRDVSRYADYLHGQVRELLTGYGPVDYLFFDFSYPGRTWGGKGRDDWRSGELLALIRSLQPDVVVNDRLDLELEGDVLTPEQYQPTSSLSGDGRLWEACQTLNGSWGYDRDNLDWKTPDQLIRMLVDGVSKDGNLLLNVGPTGRGEFEPRAVGTLDAIGPSAARCPPARPGGTGPVRHSSHDGSNRPGHRPGPAGAEHHHERAGCRRADPYLAGPPDVAVPWSSCSGAAAVKSQRRTGVPPGEGLHEPGRPLRHLRRPLPDIDAAGRVRRDESQPGLLRGLPRHQDRRGRIRQRQRPAAGKRYVLRSARAAGADRRDPRAERSWSGGTRMRSSVTWGLYRMLVSISPLRWLGPESASYMRSAPW
jgi:hypothetical protein